MRKSSSVSTAATMSGTGTEYRNGNGYDTDNNSVDLLLTSNVVARSANSSPLAVSFLSLDLVATTTGNRLRWLVDEAKDVRLFEVEKSADGLSFFRIGQVSPQAATACQFVDAGSGAAAYYRIKAVTKDDRQQYSATLFVEGQQTALMKVYPSIASNYLHLQLPVTAGGVLFIYTMDGRLQQQITLAERQALVRLSLASLKPGAYLIRYIAGSGCTAVERFVKAG